MVSRSIDKSNPIGSILLTAFLRELLISMSLSEGFPGLLECASDTVGFYREAYAIEASVTVQGKTTNRLFGSLKRNLRLLNRFCATCFALICVASISVWVAYWGS
jgi:hypothetical protein